MKKIKRLKITKRLNIIQGDWEYGTEYKPKFFNLPFNISVVLWNKYKECKHRGYWFFLWKRQYLFCERCKQPIPKKVVFKNADILCSRADGYFMTSNN